MGGGRVAGHDSSAVHSYNFRKLIATYIITLYALWHLVVAAKSSNLHPVAWLHASPLAIALQHHPLVALAAPTATKWTRGKTLMLRGLYGLVAGLPGPSLRAWSEVAAACGAAASPCAWAAATSRPPAAAAPALLRPFPAAQQLVSLRGFGSSPTRRALGVVDKLHDEQAVVLPAEGRGSRHFWEVRAAREIRVIIVLLTPVCLPASTATRSAAHSGARVSARHDRA